MAGSERRGRSKSKQDKKSTEKKSPGKKKKSKVPFSHIGAHLLPSAALAPAVPASPKRILKHRSPSPVANAIACVSRVGKLVIGELPLTSSQQAISDGQEEEFVIAHIQGNEIEEYDPDYEEVYPDGYPNVHQMEEEFTNINEATVLRGNEEPLYSTVKKRGNDRLTVEEGRQDGDDSDDSIYIVSDVEDGYANIENTAPETNYGYTLGDGNELSEGEVERSLNRSKLVVTQGKDIHTEANNDIDYANGRGTDIGSGIHPLASARSNTSTEKLQDRRVQIKDDQNEDSYDEDVHQRRATLRHVEELGFDGLSAEYGLKSTPREKDFFKLQELETETVVETPNESQALLFLQNASHERSKAVSPPQSVPPLKLDFVDVKEQVIHEEIEPTTRSENISVKVSSDSSAVEPLRPAIRQYDLDAASRLERIVMQQEKMIEKLHSELNKQEGVQSSLNQKQIEILQLAENLKSEQTPMKLSQSNGYSPRKSSQKQNEVLSERSVSNSQDFKSSSKSGVAPMAHNIKKEIQNTAVKGPSHQRQKPENSIDKEKQALHLQLEKEKRKFEAQQKVIKEQQRQLLEAQKKTLQSQNSPSNQRVASPPYRHKASSPYQLQRSSEINSELEQAILLESRLKQLEEERSALIHLNESLQDENKAIKALSAVYHEKGGPDGIALKKHREAIMKENEELKAIIHRLNIELSRYQANYREPAREEIMDSAFQPDGPVPSWLINIKYLSPLVLAYDDKLREKNKLIKTFENQLVNLKERTQEIVQENQQLHLTLETRNEPNEGVTHDEWVHLQEQAKLVVEENGLLMKQLELKDKRAEESRKEHSEEVSKVLKQLRRVESEKRELEMTLSNLYLKVEKFQKKQERLQSELSSRISTDKHKSIIEDISLESQTKNEKLLKENESLSEKLEAITKECRELAVKLTDESASKLRLQTDLSVSSKTTRQLEKRLLFMQGKLQMSQEKEKVVADTLRQVVAVAEKTAAERDSYLEIIQSQELSKDHAKKQAKENDIRIKELKAKLKDYKNLAEKNEDLASNNSKDHQRELSVIREKYEAELNSFRTLVREKQKLLEEIQSDKSRLEDQLDKLVQNLQTEDVKLTTVKA